MNKCNAFIELYAMGDMFWAVQPTAHKKPPLLFVGLQRRMVPLPIDTLDTQG